MVLVSDEGLSTLKVRPSFWKYLGDIWSIRAFVYKEAQVKAFSTGRDTFLGRLWLFLDPIFQVSLYGLVFGLILQVSRGMDNFIGFLVIGVIFFRVLTRGLSSGSSLIQKSRGLISSFHFPRAALPVSSTLRNFLDDLLPSVLAIACALLFQLNNAFSWTVVLVIPLYILMHIFTLGTMLFVARATAFIPDLKSIITLSSRGLFFVSGVFFDISRFDSHPEIQQIMMANPIYQFLNAVRVCVLGGGVPPLEQWLYLSAWSFGLLIMGAIYFWSAEERYSSVK